MKKLMQLIAAIKAIASLAFAALIMAVTVVSMLYGRDSVPISYIWQAIFLALIYGCVQFIAFSESCFTRMRSIGRLAILALSMFTALAVFAVMFRWFHIHSLMNWLVFAGLYVVVFAVATFTLRTVFRLSGIKYNQMLAAYNGSHDNG